MPELTPLSPILDGLMAGQCFTEHDGVHCYPAIRLETGEKYIIKVVCVPASETQAEALRLTGAFTDEEDARRYFNTLAQEVLSETRTLNELSLLEGFVGCEDVQLEETEDGFRVYILTPYRETAEALLKSQELTHQAALQLGLDLCAALTACRRAGYMYIDLKPDNIFRSEKGNFCIGDIGFTTLRALKYASLPEKYRSSYTAPEMADCFAQLNDTLDVYALGLVLYQAYNGGALPFEGSAPAQPLPPPMYADYELSEIILKACDPDPANRPQEPSAIGQALNSYMQRNDIGDDPIIPAPPVEEPEEEVPSDEAVEEFLPDMSEEELLAALELEDTMQAGEQDELQLIAALAAEDPNLNAADLANAQEEASDEETAQMLAQAEELMTLIPPEPVVAPEAIHVPIPPLVFEEEPQDQPDVAAEDTDLEPAPEENAEPPAAEQSAPIPPRRRKPKKEHHWEKWIAALIVLIILAGIAAGGYYYYDQVYLQYIEAIHINGTDSTATVTVISDIDESLLTLICTDSYGNSHPAKLENGKARLENLNPQTRYTVTVKIQGFHQLFGETSSHFTTASRTDIQSFQASVGPTDGSVTLTFTSSGPQPDSWKVICTAEGQETVAQTFSGTAVTVSGLSIGSEYTFLLEPVGELYLSGQTQICFTAVKLVYAKDPVIDSFHDGLLHISWEAPEDTFVENWTVHCFNAGGYDETITTSDTQFTFQEVDPSTATTVEITAAGMNKSVSTTIGPDPVTIWNFPYTVEEGVGIQLGWTFTDKAPEGGWNLHWSIDGTAMPPIACEQNTIQIPVFVPGGVYEFTLEAADNTHIFGGSFTLVLPQVESFSGFGLTNSDILCRSFLVPAAEYSWQELPEESFMDTFTAADSIGLLLTTALPIEETVNTVAVNYVIRGTDGSIVSTAYELLQWNLMWIEGGCILAPVLPTTAGSYVLSIYFDGMLLSEVPVTIQ